LQEVGLQGITVTEARDLPQKAYRALSGAEYVVDFLPKVKIKLCLATTCGKGHRRDPSRSPTGVLATADIRVEYREAIRIRMANPEPTQFKPRQRSSG